MGATAGDRFGRRTKSPNWPDYRPIESRLPDRPFPPRPTQFGDGNRQQGGNQRPASLNFRIGWQSAREISDCVQLVGEVLLKSLRYMAKNLEVEKTFFILLGNPPPSARVLNKVGGLQPG